MPTLEVAPLASASETAVLPAKLHTFSIVALAASLRLAVVWGVATHNPHDWLFHRGIELGILAGNLRAGLGFSSPFGGSTGPTALLAPGYPAIEAVVFRIFGSFSYASELAVMLMQTVFCCLTVMLIMRIAHCCFGVGTANLAGFIWAVGVPLLWMPTISWETSLSALLLTTVFALSLRCAERPSFGMWVLLGALCGGAALINPALVLALFALMGWAAYRTRTASVPRYAPVLAVLIAFLIITPWVVRNERVLHALIPVRSSFGFELWNGNHEGAKGIVEDALNPAFNPHEFALYSSVGEMSYMHQKSAIAKEFILHHPGTFARFTLRRFALFWSGAGHRDGEHTSGLVVMHMMFTILVGLTGLALLIRQRPMMALLFALPLLIFPLPYYLTHADVRYRLIIDPLLTVLTAYALTRGFGSTSSTEAEPAS